MTAPTLTWDSISNHATFRVGCNQSDAIPLQHVSHAENIAEMLRLAEAEGRRTAMENIAAALEREAKNVRARKGTWRQG